MAPLIAMDPPLEVELRLADARSGETEPYPYRLRWDARLSIERGEATDAATTIIGDSSVWTEIPYQGRSLDDMRVTGDRDAAARLVACFAEAGDARHRSR